MMFSGFGRFERKLDYKGRLTIPEDFLKASEEPWERVVTLRDTAEMGNRGDGVNLLLVYDLATWKEYLRQAHQKLEADQARIFMDRVVGDAATLDLDGMKRITIPASLLQHAAIEKEAVVVGVFDHIEVWKPESYAEYIAGIADEVPVPSISDLARGRIRVAEDQAV